MGNFKGTQGKWKSIGREIRTKNSGIILAHVYEHLPSNQSEEEALANAKLIAAAPDLLEELKEMIRMYESVMPDGGWQGVYEEAKGAIKKATE